MSDWMSKNKLKIDEDKTEFKIVETCKHRSKMLFDLICVGRASIKASSKVNKKLLLAKSRLMRHQCWEITVGEILFFYNKTSLFLSMFNNNIYLAFEFNIEIMFSTK